MKNHPDLLQGQTAWIRRGGLAAPLENSWEINLGMGLLAMRRAWKGFFGEKGLGQGTEAAVNNPDRTCVAGGALTASAVPCHSASSTEPRQIRNSNPGPAGGLQPDEAWMGFSCCRSLSLSEPPWWKRPGKATGSNSCRTRGDP